MPLFFDQSPISLPQCQYKYLPSDNYQLLNGVWKFKLSNNPTVRPVDFYKNSYDASSWRTTIAVPSDWQFQGYDQPYYLVRHYFKIKFGRPD